MANITARSTEHHARALRTTTRGSAVMVVLLLIQYVLGLTYNLFGAGPAAGHPLQMFSNPLLGTHSAVGMLLILGAIYVLIAGIRSKRALPCIASIVGIVSVIGAFASGTAFLPGGANVASMTMGSLMALALLSYAFAAWTRNGTELSRAAA